MSKFELIIFDCDGVLVDSERIANEVFARVLKEECGLSFTLNDMFDTFVGHSKKQCMQIVEEMIGQAPPPSLEHRYQHEINQELEKSVVAVTGIEQVLDEISQPICVASGGSIDKMQITLGKTNLLHRFNGNIFSATDVARPKPFPDIYLHAAQSMGCENPDRCLVIEDSPLGVKGGISAGMTVIGFAELMNEQKLKDAGAHRIIKSMSSLVDEINEYGTQG